MNPFEFDWEQPISNDEQNVILQKIADQVSKRGLQTPVVWFLEIHKPLAHLGGQMAILFSPFLATLFGGGAYDLQKYTIVLQKTTNIDTLIRMLDQPADHTRSIPVGGTSIQ